MAGLLRQKYNRWSGRKWRDQCWYICYWADGTVVTGVQMVEGCQVILNEAQGLRQGGHSTVQMFSEPSHRHVMFLQPTDIFKFVSVMGYILYWHFHKTCHIMSWLGDDGRVTGEKAGKLVTVIWVSILTFVNVKPLDNFEDTLGHFPVVPGRHINNVYDWTSAGVFWRQDQMFLTRHLDISSRYFKPKHSGFLTLTSWVLLLPNSNQSISTREKLKIKLNLGEM